MRHPRNSVAWGLWANAALLLAILVAMLSRNDSPSFLPAALAQPQGPIAGGAGVFVMPAQLSANTWGCYLLDVDQQTLCAYQFYPGDKLLRLMAARNFKYDRKLGSYNTTPSPREVGEMVEKEMNPERGGGQAPAAPSPQVEKQ